MVRPLGLVSPESTPGDIEEAPEIEATEEDEGVEAQPDLSTTAMVRRDVSRVEAPGISVEIVVEKKSRVSAVISAVGEDTSVIRALIGRMRPAITPATVEVVVVVIAVVAIEIAVVEEGEEVAPSCKKPTSSRETSKDSPACARWGVPTEDHS